MARCILADLSSSATSIWTKTKTLLAFIMKTIFIIFIHHSLSSLYIQVDFWFSSRQTWCPMRCLSKCIVSFNFIAITLLWILTVLLLTAKFSFTIRNTLSRATFECVVFVLCYLVIVKWKHLTLIQCFNICN